MSNDELSMIALRRAIRAWPALAVDADGFALHVQRLAVNAQNLALYGHELYLAFACARLEARALAILERDYIARITPAIARVDGSKDFVDEVCQAVRRRLLVGSEAKIGQYGAAGSLGAWLRVMGLRLALDHKKAWRNREELLFGALAETLDSGAESNARYRETVENALHGAFVQLNVRERNLLRLHYVEALSIDRIGTMYGAHRATAARWIARARERIFDSVIQDLQARFGMGQSDARGVLLGVRSQLEVSVRRLLEAERELMPSTSSESD